MNLGKRGVYIILRPKCVGRLDDKAAVSASVSVDNDDQHHYHHDFRIVENTDVHTL